MRAVKWVFISLVLVLHLQAPVLAAHYDAVIIGQANSEIDLPAVQNAVNQGGSLLLKGIFDFGDAGSVTIRQDIDIIGETTPRGAPLTKIVGGRWTFYSPLPSVLPPTQPGPKITIQNIHFDGALWAPVSLPYCSGAEIANNKITNVRPIESKQKFYGREGIFRQQGILFVPLYTLPKGLKYYQPGSITGTIRVADNNIDLSNTVPEKTLSQGVFVLGATGANILLLNNRVVNSSRNSLESLDNYPGKDGSGMTLIQGNTIITPTKGVPIPTPATPNGIIAGWFLDRSGAWDPKRNTRIIVRKNTIESRGKGKRSIAIAVISDRAVITSNHIKLNGGPGAIGIFHSTSNALIADNKVEGMGAYAVMLREFKGRSPAHNLVMNNDFDAFNASKAHILLQGVNNIAIEKTRNILNEGQMNVMAELQR